MSRTETAIIGEPEVLEDSAAWLDLKAAAVELQGSQTTDGSIPDAALHAQARGLVERSRESDDRRIVTLRTTDEVRARSAGFHGPAARELEVAMGEHDDATLAVVRGFLERLTGVLPTGEGGAPAA